jgi:molybdopterin/thiamine biosynthesis adenylyltransferase
VPFWRNRLAGTAAAFEAELENRGFTKHADGWMHGTVPIATPGGGTVEESVRIALTDSFPFTAPRVALPTAPEVLTWHLSPEGVLCLFRASDDPGRPWETVDGLFGRIAEWFDENSKGWPDDPGDPDLQRYFGLGIEYLVTYDGAERAVGALTVEFANSKEWIHLIPNNQNRRRRRRDSTMWSYGVDIGVLAEPIWDWSTLRQALPKEHRDEIESLAMSETGVLLVHYARDGSEGVRRAAIALFMRPPKVQKAKQRGRVTTPPRLPENAEPSITVLEIADDTPAARWYRAGPDVEAMRSKHVAIIGCGAVGSFTADLLARSGVGELTLVDPERLTPGNCVRHLADRRHVPNKKVHAIRDILVAGELITADKVTAIDGRATAAIAAELLMNTHLVIDATANAAVSGLLRDIADQIGKVNFLKVSLHRDGALVRIDRYGEGTRVDNNRPEFIDAAPTAGASYREGGCGDPISPTPPAAVLHAASTASRFGLDALRPANQQQLPDSQVEVLVAQPDQPWHVIGNRT